MPDPYVKDYGRSIWSGQPIEPAKPVLLRDLAEAITAAEKAGDSEAAGRIRSERDRVEFGPKYVEATQKVRDYEDAIRAATVAGDTAAAERFRGALGVLKEEAQASGEAGKMTGAARFLTGMGGGMLRLARNVRDALPNAPVRLEREQQENDRSMGALTDYPTGGMGALTGTVLPAVPVAMAGPQVLARVLPAALTRAGASSLAPQVLSGAMEGAVMSDPGDRVSGAISGGLGAGGGNLLARGAAGTAKGLTRGLAGDARKSAVSMSTPASVAEASTPKVSVAMSLGTKFDMDEAAKAVTQAAARGEVDAPALYLMQNGVELAPWQIAAPGTRLAKVGKALTSVDEADKIAERAYAQTRGLILSKATPPGMEIAKGTAVENVGATVDKMLDGFEAAYDGIKGHQVYPTIIRTDGQSVPLRVAMKDALDELYFGDPAALARAESQVDRRLRQIGVNPDKAEAVSQIDAGGLMKIRSGLRQRRGTLASSTDMAAVDEREALGIIEDKITEALDSQLPPDVAAQLQSIDRRYASFAPIRDAQAAAYARRPGKAAAFTPSDLSRFVVRRKSANMRATGDVGDLTPDIEAFERIWNDAPRTGERVSTLAQVKDAVLAATIEPAMARASTGPGAYRAILREGGLSRGARKVEDLAEKLAPYMPAAAGELGGAVGGLYGGSRRND